MDSPLGSITLAATAKGLCFLSYTDRPFDERPLSSRPATKAVPTVKPGIPISVATWLASLSPKTSLEKLEGFELEEIEEEKLVGDELKEGSALHALSAARTAIKRFFEHWEERGEDFVANKASIEDDGSLDVLDPFSSVPVDLSVSSKASSFRMAVWEALRTIPVGRTWDYEELAAHCGKKGAARAAGTAVGSNPIPLIVPCHRIIGRNGSMRGFGFGGIEVKKQLLSLEKVIASAAK
ncbi:hypothetical protein HDU96_000886 [Phlyctochytrium bullatum]|nr:hypothetical protein HDU96_000886 [Phlyctochytrium bullatum]